MADLTPQEFAARWSKSKLSERSAYQQHFLDVWPRAADPVPRYLLSVWFRIRMVVDETVTGSLSKK